MLSCCSSLLCVLEMCITKLLCAAVLTFSALAVLKVHLKRHVKWHFRDGVVSVLLLDLCICTLTVQMVQAE